MKLFFSTLVTLFVTLPALANPCPNNHCIGGNGQQDRLLKCMNHVINAAEEQVMQLTMNGKPAQSYVVSDFGFGGVPGAGYWTEPKIYKVTLFVSNEVPNLSEVWNKQLVYMESKSFEAQPDKNCVFKLEAVK